MLTHESITNHNLDTGKSPVNGNSIGTFNPGTAAVMTASILALYAVFNNISNMMYNLQSQQVNNAQKIAKTMHDQIISAGMARMFGVIIGACLVLGGAVFGAYQSWKAGTPSEELTSSNEKLAQFQKEKEALSQDRRSLMVGEENAGEEGSIENTTQMNHLDEFEKATSAEREQLINGIQDDDVKSAFQEKVSKEQSDAQEKNKLLQQKHQNNLQEVSTQNQAINNVTGGLNSVSSSAGNSVAAAEDGNKAESEYSQNVANQNIQFTNGQIEASRQQEQKALSDLVSAAQTTQYNG